MLFCLLRTWALLRCLIPLHRPHAWLHSDGQTALFYAVDEGHVSIAKTLIAAKADVNAKAK